MARRSILDPATIRFHRPSGSLLVTDLLFNILEPAGATAHVFYALVGVRRRLAQSRVWWFLRKDRAAYAASVDRVLALPFTRLVPCHGAVCEDARDRVAAILARSAGRTA